MLFSRCEYEICSAVDALKHSILKLRHSHHSPLVPSHLNLLSSRAAGPEPRPPGSFDIPACFFPVSLSGQRLLDPALLARLQVKRVPFDLFNDVLLLDFSLEPAKGVLQSFALLKLYFRQMKYTSPLI